MPKTTQSFEVLRKYLPPDTFEMLMPLIREHHVQLTITRSRQSKLGDYRHAPGKQHRISINSDLNKYAFLITLLHELAHLLAFQEYGSRIQAHGREWKKTYASILVKYLEAKVFPEDIHLEISASLHNPGASTCSEEALQRVLLRYDVQKKGIKTVEQLPDGALFEMTGGRRFRRLERVRKRIKCVDMQNGRLYLFNALHEVKELTSEAVEVPGSAQGTLFDGQAAVPAKDPLAGMKPVSQVVSGKTFLTSNGKLYRKGDLVRTRYQCLDLKTGVIYLFPPSHHVMEISSS